MVKDHLGREYETTKDMCNSYGIDYKTFWSRLKRGCSLEESLASKKVTDHLGKEYKTNKDMCDSYGVHYMTFRARRRRGLTVEQSLIVDENVIDHNGKRFSSISEMCRHHGVYYETFCLRIRKGKSLAECLATKERKPRSIKPKLNITVDHIGNKYKSTAEMCKAYGVSEQRFRYRWESGHDLRGCLTGEFVVDHLNNGFRSFDALCKYHGVNIASLKANLDRGLNMEEAIEKLKKRKAN